MSAYELCNVVQQENRRNQSKSSCYITQSGPSTFVCGALFLILWCNAWWVGKTSCLAAKLRWHAEAQYAVLCKFRNCDGYQRNWDVVVVLEPPTGQKAEITASTVSFFLHHSKPSALHKSIHSSLSSLIVCLCRACTRSANFTPHHVTEFCICSTVCTCVTIAFSLSFKALTNISCFLYLMKHNKQLSAAVKTYNCNVFLNKCHIRLFLHLI